MPRRTAKLNLRISQQQLLLFQKAASINAQNLQDFVRSACVEYSKKVLGAVQYKRTIRAMSDEQQAIKNMTEEEHMAWADRQNTIADNDPSQAIQAPLRAPAAPETSDRYEDITPYEAPPESPEAMQARIHADALERNQNDAK